MVMLGFVPHPNLRSYRMFIIQYLMDVNFLPPIEAFDKLWVFSIAIHIAIL